MTKIPIVYKGRTVKIRTYKSNLAGLSAYERGVMAYEAY